MIYKLLELKFSKVLFSVALYSKYRLFFNKFPSSLSLCASSISCLSSLFYIIKVLTFFFLKKVFYFFKKKIPSSLSLCASSISCLSSHKSTLVCNCIESGICQRLVMIFIGQKRPIRVKRDLLFVRNLSAAKNKN